MTDRWSLIHAERRALADDLSGLTPEQWAMPSLCTGWSVREVLGHLTASAKLTAPTFFVRLARSGFSFNSMVDRALGEQLGGTSADTLANFRGILDATSHPPGPVTAMVGEIVVHSADIRVPLGLSHTYSSEAMTRTADFYRSSNLLIGAKKRTAGLALRATDVDWSSGTGPEVSGPMISILLAMSGRSRGADDLSGEGVQTLRARL